MADTDTLADLRNSIDAVDAELLSLLNRRAELAQWIREGHIGYLEDVTDGLENTPETFIGMFLGENFGKTLIRVST